MYNNYIISATTGLLITYSRSQSRLLIIITYTSLKVPLCWETICMLWYQLLWFQGRMPPWPDRLERRSENKPQDLLRQEEKKIFQSR